jgi:hypothetical protein
MTYHACGCHQHLPLITTNSVGRQFCHFCGIVKTLMASCGIGVTSIHNHSAKPVGGHQCAIPLNWCSRNSVESKGSRCSTRVIAHDHGQVEIARRFNPTLYASSLKALWNYDL